MRDPAFAWSDLGSEVVVLDRACGELLRLNSVAAAIWRQLDGTRTLEDIAGSLCSRFALDRKVAERDVSRFLRELRSLGLVTTPADLQAGMSAVEWQSAKGARK